MAKALCEGLPAARQLFKQASDLLGYDLLDVCINGPVERLNSTEVSQPAIFVASLAALESLQQSDSTATAHCVATAGLSLGEYTALVFAGAMTFADGLRVVRKRGQAMQAAADATPSAMVSVLGLEHSKVEELCGQARSKGLIEVANLLCPSNIVVSGTTAACDEVERLAPAMGAMKTIRLAVAGAFHTNLMKPADEALASTLDQVNITTPRLPVWSNVDGQPHTEAAQIRQLLVNQVIKPVLWEKIIRSLLLAGVDKFYEIGPGRVLAGLLKRVERKAVCVNVAA
jgi:[acyl-carrier-protein] S-malonyltransferase